MLVSFAIIVVLVIVEVETVAKHIHCFLNEWSRAVDDRPYQSNPNNAKLDRYILPAVRHYKKIMSQMRRRKRSNQKSKVRINKGVCWLNDSVQQFHGGRIAAAQLDCEAGHKQCIHERIGDLAAEHHHHRTEMSGANNSGAYHVQRRCQMMAKTQHFKVRKLKTQDVAITNQEESVMNHIPRAYLQQRRRRFLPP